MSPLEELATKFPQHIVTPFQGSLNIIPNGPGDWRVSIFEIEGSYDVSCMWGFSQDVSEFPRPRAIRFENLDPKGLEQAVKYLLELKKGF